MIPTKILISISDPWDLGEALKWQTFGGKLIQIANDDRGGRALIKLDDSINYHGSSWRYVIASARHQGGKIASLQTGQKLFAAFTGIPNQQAESSWDLDTSNWRGGLAFVGDIEPAN